MEEKRKPDKKCPIGRITACIWRNLSKAGRPWYNVKVIRTYQDDGEGLRDAMSFSYSDLPCIGRALEDAMSWIRDQREIDDQDMIPRHAMDEGTKAKPVRDGRRKRRSK